MDTQIGRSTASAPVYPDAEIFLDSERSNTRIARIRAGIDAAMARRLPHPFYAGMTRDNALRVAQHFLGISLGFPYAQAGSQLALLNEFIDENRAPRAAVEVTTAVGNFLSWDETGGHWTVLQQGNAGLPSILDTGRNFHGNMLKRDLACIFGRPVLPDFTITGPYLRALCAQFSDRDDVLRCAAMVSFERHAEIVITALWGRLVAIFGLDKNQYDYFTTHVGDDDPAEIYHIRMTERMIDRIVTDADVEHFLCCFEESFALHIQWSADITAD